MKYSAKSIANFFLRLAGSESVSPMKMQKLVYYANGWYSGYTGESLINEPVEAWPYGPVIPSLYHEFKKHGGGRIEGPAYDFNFSSQSFEPAALPDDPNVQRFLTNVWNSYGAYTAIKLSEMTHAPGGPWDVTWKGAGGMRGKDIPHQVLVEHFKQAVERSRQQGGAQA